MLLEPELVTLELDVADRVLGPTTIFRQRARPLELTIKFLPGGCREVRLLLLRVQYGRNLDGSYGDELAASDTNAASNQILLVGNSACAVDATTGKPRFRLISEGLALPSLQVAGSALNVLTNVVEPFEPGQTYRQWLEAKPEAYMLQDRYFGVVASRFEVNIDDLVIDYAQDADTAPSRFA